MPHWIVYHPPTTFQSVEEKRSLVKDITALYNMPSFYVVVNFMQKDPTDHWIAGMMASERSQKPFIRITIAHINVRQPDDDEKHRMLREKWSAMLKPHTLDKGYDYEFHIEETERRLWAMNGLHPPPWKGEDEMLWGKEGRPLSEEEMIGLRGKE